MHFLMHHPITPIIKISFEYSNFVYPTWKLHNLYYHTNHPSPEESGKIVISRSVSKAPFGKEIPALHGFWELEKTLLYT